MSRNKYLAAAPRIVAKFLRQFLEQFRVELVLRFLDRQQWERLRIMEQHQVGEHLDGAIGDIARDEGILKRAILETEHEPTIFGRFGLYLIYPWHPPSHRVQDDIELLTMVVVEKLRHLGDIIAAG